MKKPEVVKAYKSGMNGVDVNDQYRSHYPPGTTACKWWKYLFWFFMNLSMVNAFILEKLAGKRRRTQLDFRRELAKLLIAGYNSYKRPSNTANVCFKLGPPRRTYVDIFSVNLSAGKRLAQYVPSYKKELSDLKVALSNLCTLANSVAFLFADKCMGNNLDFLSGIAALHK